MFVLCALSGALLVLCVVLNREHVGELMSAVIYKLADCVKHTDTNHPTSISACSLYVTVSLVLMCLANITSLVPQWLYLHSHAVIHEKWIAFVGCVTRTQETCQYAPKLIGYNTIQGVHDVTTSCFVMVNTSSTRDLSSVT